MAGRGVGCHNVATWRRDELECPAVLWSCRLVILSSCRLVVSSSCTLPATRKFETHFSIGLWKLGVTQSRIRIPTGSSQLVTNSNSNSIVSGPKLVMNSNSKTCLLVQQENMFSGSTRRHVFLFNKKTCFLVQQEDMSSCSTRTHVFLFSKKTCLLVQLEAGPLLYSGAGEQKVGGAWAEGHGEIPVHNVCCMAPQTGWVLVCFLDSLEEISMQLYD